MLNAALPLLASWVVLANHTHTLASPDSAYQVADLDRLAKAKGVQAVVVTDHNNVRAVLDPAFKATDSITFIEGQEWGSRMAKTFWGHVGIIGLEGDIDVDPLKERSDMFAEAKQRGAVAVINHPFNWALFWREPDIPEDAGGVEVWNQSWNMVAMDNSRSLLWWDAALRNGRRLLAVGGSDVHGVSLLGGDAWPSSAIDSPVNLVWAQDTTVPGIMAGVRAGHVIVVRNSQGPRVELQATLGDRIAMVGDELPAVAEGMLRARVTGGKGLVLTFHSKAGKVFEQTLETDDQIIERPQTLAADGDFVRAELREPSGWPEPAMVALTNPIYFRN